MGDDEEPIRQAFAAGQTSGGKATGSASDCPFARGQRGAERIAWLSGFNVGRLSADGRSGPGRR